jgi:hypothetical protein
MEKIIQLIYYKKYYFNIKMIMMKVLIKNLVFYLIKK